MIDLQTEVILIIICTVVVMSYLFSIASRYVRVPSVLMLMGSGMLIRIAGNYVGWSVQLPQKLIEMLGVVGLIMIVLEAGLDLKLARSKIPLVRNSLLSATILLALSVVSLTAVLFYALGEPLRDCLVYAIPLSIMSSAIVLPSLHPLTPEKQEFLIYEASFSDIIGILLFNFITVNTVVDLSATIGFFANLVVSVILSLLLSYLLFLILARTRLNIKFFLVFSLLILLYSGGKLLHLPSLIIILVFGLMINNWELIRWKFLQQRVSADKLSELRHLLHAVTAETSFLIRTFFFVLFGYSIDTSLLADPMVLKVGSIIVLLLFLIRFLYLRFFLRTYVFPETFFIPRGLITIVLYYKIPEVNKMDTFNEGILFFVILVTSLIMTIGMVFYKKPAESLVEESQFSEHQQEAFRKS
jgi:Kef-type K+ transport system membrane component KefB